MTLRVSPIGQATYHIAEPWPSPDRPPEIPPAALGTVDLVIGHHAHVLQPIDRIEDMCVAYGLGNFLSNQNPVCCTPSSGDGAILHVEVGNSPDGLAVRTVTYTPTWVDRGATQVIPVADRLAEPDLAHWLQATLRKSWRRTVEAWAPSGPTNSGSGPAGRCHRGIRPRRADR